MAVFYVSPFQGCQSFLRPTQGPAPSGRSALGYYVAPLSGLTDRDRLREKREIRYAFLFV